MKYLHIFLYIQFLGCGMGKVPTKYTVKHEVSGKVDVEVKIGRLKKENKGLRERLNLCIEELEKNI